MSLQAGGHLGPYEVVSLLGSGGMGEVYRARDTKLNRDVAIKVLPDAVGDDPERLARFRREAQLLAALNHPNIAQIHGYEESEGIHALVMELVEGPTLADRIAKGPIPLREALPIMKQIAEALEAAHEQGIIHRDLKPANIKVRDDGTVKVLDFGLAKLVEPSGNLQSINATASPTITSPAITGVGVILGTAAYMSPEQAVGGAADRRSDLWAFGVVVMEMLTGRRVFSGETVSHVLASVLKDEPDWTRLPQATPPAVRTLLRRCLEKDRKPRLDSAAVARLEIEDAALFVTDTATPRQRSGKRGAVAAWIAATVLAATTVALAVRAARTPSPADGRIQKASLLPPPDATVNRDYVALSPDGRFVTFVASHPNGHPLLWVRALDGLSAQALPGTDEARLPFWSPDSRFIGFFAERKLKKVQPTGGPVQVICDARYGFGGTWNRNGIIVFAPDAGAPLSQVSANGGAPRAATALDPAREERTHSGPAFLQDGQHFIYVAGTASKRTLTIGSLDSLKAEPLVEADSGALYAPADSSKENQGYLVYVRDNVLLAQPFDAGRRALTGDPVPVGDSQVQVASAGSTAPFSVSPTTLAYRSFSPDAELVWFDRAGRRIGTLGDPARYDGVELSPDGRRLAVERADPRTHLLDLWLTGVNNEPTTQFTFMGGTRPRWASDGQILSFQRDQKILRKRVDGSGTEELLSEIAGLAAFSDWSPDGRLYVIRSIPPLGGGAAGGLWLLPATVGATPITQTVLRGYNGRFSPDGKWLAYTADDSGVNEVYVQRVPSTGAKWKISQNGGIRPRWRRDGKEVFFVESGNVNGAGRLMAVPIELAATVRIGSPQALVDAPFVPKDANVYPYAISGDGQRILMIRPADAPDQSAITLVLNWTAALRKN